MDAPSNPIFTAITTYEWIEPARGCKEGTFGLTGTASAAESELCTWQQARSPDEVGTGQLELQHGDWKTSNASATPQLNPACSTSRRANDAKNPFFIPITLILYAAADNDETTGMGDA